jgi:hypothetical protein
MLTMNQFIERLGVQFSAERTKDNPHMLDAMDSASHWRCLLRKDQRRMIVHFSQGSAHTKPPTAVDVLDCLASDASDYENAQDFEDWCAEYGYDSDSRKDQRTYRKVKRQSDALRRVLGSTASYETLLWETERE